VDAVFLPAWEVSWGLLRNPGALSNVVGDLSVSWREGLRGRA
jgi:hypothetical protein